jgi:hypothetical protein
VINFYNERLAPSRLLELLTQVVPEKYHHPLVFTYGRRHMPEGYKYYSAVATDSHIFMNLEAISFWILLEPECGSRSARIWRKMLYAGFHEFAHVALGHCKASELHYQRYMHDREYKAYIEGQAERKANSWIQAVLMNNSRLYQPNYLGVVDLIERRLRSRFRVEPMDPWHRKEYRCRVTGGQLSIGDVFCSVFRQPCKLKRNRIYGLIHRYADDLARVYKDSVGRLYRFWVWGDLPIIADRLRQFYDGLADAEVEWINQLKELEENLNRIQEGQIILPAELGDWDDSPAKEEPEASKDGKVGPA